MKLSVISIAFNNLEGLKKTLQLFIDQSFPDIEIVVVDGGSKDGTADYLKTLPTHFKWVSEPDKGIYNAMNKGLQMAGGDYVWFLNSGDFAYSQASVEELMTLLKANMDAVYGETMMVSASGEPLGTRSQISTRHLPETLTWESFRMGMNVSHQSFVIRRTLALPYNESYRYVADIDWMIRSLKQCHAVGRMKSILSCFTLDGFSSKHRKASNRERYQVLRKHYGFIPNLLAHFRIVFRKVFNPKGI